MARCQDVTDYLDIMFLSKIPFLISKSRKIKFGTIEMMKDQKQKSIINALQQIVVANKSGRLCITKTSSEG